MTYTQDNLSANLVDNEAVVLYLNGTAIIEMTVDELIESTYAVVTAQQEE